MIKKISILLLFFPLGIQINLLLAQDNRSEQLTQVVNTTLKISETKELIELKRYDQASKIIGYYLKKKPRDAQWRYLKAVLYADRGLHLGDEDQIFKSINIFERLTEEFPELAETYNNLAVLYISQNEGEKARKALDTAIVNRPNYILAYENLADLHIYFAKSIYLEGLSKDNGSSERLRAKADHINRTPYLSKPKLNLDFKSKTIEGSYENKN